MAVLAEILQSKHIKFDKKNLADYNVYVPLNKTFYNFFPKKNHVSITDWLIHSYSCTKTSDDYITDMSNSKF